MARRAGSADLPLHGGRVPPWLAERMARLGAVIAEAIVHHYGRDEFLRRLAHPFWFQSFGAVMGMDWHSSGITTSVIGALKRGLAPLSRRARPPCLRRPRPAFAPDARTSWSRSASASASTARRSRSASRLVAKVDSAAVQDGFDLYLHGFIVTDDGHWVGRAAGHERRAPAGAPLSLAVAKACTSFVDEPHARDRRARTRARSSTSPTVAPRPRARGQLELLQRSRARPHRRASSRALEGERRAAAAGRQPLLPHLVMPAHHDVRPERRDRCAACTARSPRRPIAGPTDFAELLLVPGVGARTVRALAMVAEVVHGAPCRFADPARFSLAHGGKDRHPFPVPIKVYDETIGVLKSAVAQRQARQRREARRASSRLDEQARRLERARDRARRSTPSSPRSGAARTSMAAAACSAGSRRRRHVRRKSS